MRAGDAPLIQARPEPTVKGLFSSQPSAGMLAGMDSPTYDDVLAAVPIVHRYLCRTPLLEWPALSQLLGCRYWLKHENHLPTTAFKVRGGVNLVSQLSDAERRRGVLACTTGNHGQSLAYACRLFQVRATLVVPTTCNPDKLAAMRALGAEIVEHGQDFDDARNHCDTLARQTGMRYVHSANEPHLIAGVGTAAWEIFEELPDPDVILVPIGLGSGISGTALVAAARQPQTRVIGIQAELAPAVARCMARESPCRAGVAAHLCRRNGDASAGRADHGYHAALRPQYRAGER